MAGGSTKFGGAGGYRVRPVKSTIKTTTTDKDDDLVKFNDLIANPKKWIKALEWKSLVWIELIFCLKI